MSSTLPYTNGKHNNKLVTKIHQYDKAVTTNISTQYKN